MSNKRALTLISLHLLLIVYSMSGIFSKTASSFPFFSMPFCLCYGMIIMLLGLYAIGWQQVIKRIPLTLAFANKAVTVLWGMLWSIVFFHEKLTLGKLCGVLCIVAGIICYALADRDSAKEDKNE